MNLLRAVVLVAATAANAWPAGAESSGAKFDEQVRFDRAPLERRPVAGVVSYAQSLKNARPGVVSVYWKTHGDLPQEDLLERYLLGLEDEGAPLPQEGLGSGVIVSENGYILTNNHVVGTADEISVQLDDGATFDAKIVGADPLTDIAVIKIEAQGLPQITFGDSGQAEIGDVVFAIGNPLGIGKTVTMGIVSATGRQGMIEGGYEDFIQTDASINPGNSGGALVDAQGRLIGINTVIRTDSRARGNIGIGFAVPANLAYGVMKSLVETGEVARGFLGVGIEDLDASRAAELGLKKARGAWVTQVQRSSPAERAGLQVGDVILAIGSEPVDGSGDFRLKIATTQPGASVTLDVLRGEERLTIEATLGRLSEDLASGPEAEPEPTREPVPFFEGVTAQPIDEALRERFGLAEGIEGLVVTEVSPRSAYIDTFPVGMVIIKINGQAVASLRSAEQALQAGARNAILVGYRGVQRWINVRLD